MEELIHSWLQSLFGTAPADKWTFWASIIAIAVVAVAVYLFLLHIAIPITNYLTRKTVTTWDDDLLNDKVLKAIAKLAPAILIGVLLPDSLHSYIKIQVWSVKLTEIYILWAGINFVIVFLRSVQAAFDKRMMLQQHNLEILRQTVVLFVVIIGVIIGIGILINRDPLAILAGVGGMAAVLMLVFRDTILSFVAGIQLTLNRMLVRGDWIVAPKAGVNGEVVEIKLTTIKVRNWDNSIVTVPPYSLVSDSFQNYANMRESGARRVCRSVLIDMTTVRRLNGVEVVALMDSGLLHEEDYAPGDEAPINLTLLRRYMERYLEERPEVLHAGNGRPELTLMARQLQPTPQGIPFELYFFTSLTVWKQFEHLQADIFDHLYAIIPKFFLTVYQAPSSNTFSQD